MAATTNHAGEITTIQGGNSTKAKKEQPYSMLEDYAIGDRIYHLFQEGGAVIVRKGTVVGGLTGSNPVLFAPVTPSSPQFGGSWNTGGEDKFCRIYVAFDDYTVEAARNPARPGTLMLICNVERTIEKSPGWNAR